MSVCNCVCVCVRTPHALSGMFLGIFPKLQEEDSSQQHRELSLEVLSVLDRRMPGFIERVRCCLIPFSLIFKCHLKALEVLLVIWKAVL